MHAWWSGTLKELRECQPDRIVGQLATRLVEAHPLNRDTQLRAWRAEIAVLTESLAGAPAHWQLLLEYPLLRLRKRIDAVLLTEHAIFVLEFKVGSTAFSQVDREQVEDYALDLFDFHAASREHPIVPILIATSARDRPGQWPLFTVPVTPVQEATADSLFDIITGCVARAPAAQSPLDIGNWEAAPYRPVPTIVEAARMLYARHGVSEIAAARSDLANLTRTTDAILQTIDQARAARRHMIVFVTGIPGAGKTLCGLNAVFGPVTEAAFLTGNLPLVFVIRAALERDARQQGRNIRDAQQETESAIQPLMGFLRDNLQRSEPPHEHVVIFDEAQRAWDADFGRRKFGHAQSEAALFLDIMHRHADWAVIVALVGNGQEINTGEAGLAAWGEALTERPDWQILAPSGVIGTSDPRQCLFAVAPSRADIRDNLHLAVPVRSVRSALAAPWVEAVLAGDPDTARSIAAEAGGIPFYVTRSLLAMRVALRHYARGSRRAGLVCSAGARRLQADGIWPNFPHLDADAMAHWFLGRWPDVRASDALELPATQFACQGLELDHVGLCWGNDLIRRSDQRRWIARRFSGSRWQERRKEADIAYQTNTYRVLLTRARYETVIWVPNGDEADITRPPHEFDAIANFLLTCGAQPLPQTTHMAMADPGNTLL